jgi:sec-independent protein translocase protein TatA
MEHFNSVFLSLPGGSEWILIVLVIVLLFGGRKIPELMKGLGQGMREFKKAKDGTSDSANQNDSKDTSIK